MFSANVKTRTKGYFTPYRKKKGKNAEKRYFFRPKKFSNPDWLSGCGRDILIFFSKPEVSSRLPKIFLSQSELSKKFYPKKSLGGKTPLLPPPPKKKMK